MNRNQTILCTGLIIVSLLGIASFLPYQTSSTNGSTQVTVNPTDQPIPVQGDLAGLGAFNYTYCGPGCQPAQQYQASMTQTCSSGMYPLECYVLTHTNSNVNPLTQTTYCGPLCQYLSSRTTATTGTAHAEIPVNATIALLLLSFNDVTPTRTAQDIETQWNRDIVSYYHAVSHNQYDAYAKTFGWYQLPYSISYYGADCGLAIDCGNSQLGMTASWQLVVDGVSLAESQGANFTNYQYLVVIHAGNGQESETFPSNLLWSVTYYSAPPAGSGDLGAFTMYSIIPETEAKSQGVVGVWAVEYGHQFGWPDMFNRDERTNARTGAWELESVGSWNGNGNTPAYTSGINQASAYWLSEGHGPVLKRSLKIIGISFH